MSIYHPYPISIERGINLYSATAESAGQVNKYSQVELWNPAGSQRVAFVRNAVILTVGASSVLASIASAAITNKGNTPTVLAQKPYLGAALCFVYNDNTLAVQPALGNGKHAVIYTTGATQVNVDLEPLLSLTQIYPGQGLLLECDTSNINLYMTLVWEEVKLGAP